MASPPNQRINRLTVFTFLWASQALIHQDFYNAWIENNNVWGWILTLFAVASISFPRSQAFFSLMLLSSLIYNVGKWPFVVNHILVESVLNAIILTALLISFFDSKTARKDRSVDRFVPVLKASLIVMYYFAILAKLNYGFFDAEHSCVVAMFDDLIRRLPFISKSYFTQQCAIWGTIAIEFAIPILLTFKRTQWIAILIGLAFHFMLGLIGHRTFSALAYSLYGLFLLPALTNWVNELHDRLTQRYGSKRLATAGAVFSVCVAATATLLVTAELTGNDRAGFGPFIIYRIPWVIWIAWSALIAVAYLNAILKQLYDPAETQASNPAKPRFLWLFVALVFLNGSSQYLGLKTETCFTMYSNLRTEGGINNHLFMPALRVAKYQDDLVEILDTNHEKLKAEYIDKDFYITAFEFQRFMSSTNENFFVAFNFQGQRDQINKRVDIKNDHPFVAPINIVTRKLLYFRPVPKGAGSPCQH